jgi:hypothetical protein
LLGLNDVEMAHATAVKVGFKNHAAFHPAVFWARLPDLLVPQSCSPGRPFPVTKEALAIANGFYKGALADPRFLASYVPIFLRPAEGTTRDWLCAFVRRDGLARWTRGREAREVQLR